jgi:hypothetical protein
LAKWVNTQRTERKKGKLSEERVRLLEGIGFEWVRHEHVLWEDRFEQLKAHKATKGDCNVPQGYERGRKGTLSKEKVKQINKLGFQWVVVGKGQRTELDESPRPTKRRRVAASAGRQQHGGRLT